MANKNFLNMAKAGEERSAIFQAAQEERQRKIQAAIDNGATVHYLSSRMTQEEWETHIFSTNDGKVIIDTTIPKDITKCLKGNWKIIDITYYKDNNQVAGMIFEGRRNNISIRVIK